MSDLVVRDHSQPCEHVARMQDHYRSAFGVDYPAKALLDCPWAASCPGGREIVLRRATRFDGSITMEDQPMWVEVIE